MKSFKTFIKESKSIRTGLPHITTMHHDDFYDLLHGGQIHLHDVTEKTDGATHKMGYDHKGFYTQSSGSSSERMRSHEDFIERAERRSKETGKAPSIEAARKFGHIHTALQNNQKLQHYLKSKAAIHGETHIKGELFYKPGAKPAEHHPIKSERHKGHIMFVGTSYDPKKIPGKIGSIVVHSKLSDNSHHDPEHLKSLSDDHVSFDHDKTPIKPISVDVSKESKHMSTIDRSILSQRTSKTNKALKMAEMSKLDSLRQKVSDKVDAHIKRIGAKPKWGLGTPEGLVIHPPAEKPTQPRFKVTSNAFRNFKKATKEQ